jgi:hypothetical protein
MALVSRSPPHHSPTMAKITARLLDRNCEVLCKTLDRPSEPWKDGKAQIGCIHIGRTGYGYSIEEIISDGGTVNVLASGLTAAECYHWIQGALATCRLLRQDGPIADRWNGRSLRGARQCAVVKYVGQSNTRPSRWIAKLGDSNGAKFRAAVPFDDGPVAAAMKLAAKMGQDWKPTHIACVDPSNYVVTF